MRGPNFLRNFRWLIIVGLSFSVLALPLITSAQPTTSVTISNASAREIRHVYLSPVNSDDWSADQLNNSMIGPGQTVTLGISCDQQVKVIAEDKDGCFGSTIVSCGDNSTWAITDETTFDCH
jgi:hypothetical protein